mmetsp:Transcript_46169/g.144414  ORF Transcript_46169/g.144414 Transcript_46169/m.144414 type:complete len:204 (+) Transcript_46169:698-1309(+)
MTSLPMRSSGVPPRGRRRVWTWTPSNRMCGASTAGPTMGRWTGRPRTSGSSLTSGGRTRASSGRTSSRTATASITAFGARSLGPAPNPMSSTSPSPTLPRTKRRSIYWGTRRNTTASSGFGSTSTRSTWSYLGALRTLAASAAAGIRVSSRCCATCGTPSSRSATRSSTCGRTRAGARRTASTTSCSPISRRFLCSSSTGAGA